MRGGRGYNAEYSPVVRLRFIMTKNDLLKLQAYNALIGRFAAKGRLYADLPQQIQDLANHENALKGRSFSEYSVQEFQGLLSRLEVEEQLSVAREVMKEREEVLRKLAE